MYDLSWLNPTPHTITVYASRPLSPVATQHSLPSGRYSLLGPDLHRLDRTSFAWRTHSMTSSAPADRPSGTSRASEIVQGRLIEGGLRFRCKSAYVGDALLGRRFPCSNRLRRQLEYSRFLSFKHVSQQHCLPVWK